MGQAGVEVKVNQEITEEELELLLKTHSESAIFENFSDARYWYG